MLCRTKRKRERNVSARSRTTNKLDSVKTPATGTKATAKASSGQKPRGRVRIKKRPGPLGPGLTSG
ncbi:hypothetical protein D3C83_232150 [compost metagenome]